MHSAQRSGDRSCETTGLTPRAWHTVLEGQVRALAIKLHTRGPNRTLLSLPVSPGQGALQGTSRGAGTALASAIVNGSPPVTGRAAHAG